MVELKDNNLEILIFKEFLNKEQSDWLLKYFLSEVSWKQDKYKFSGKEFLSPRLTALYGSKPYSYSGQTLNPTPFSLAFIKLKKIIEEASNSDFNVVLLNQYRNGQDSVSWHSDSEKDLGENPVIASLSLGGKRPFKLREKANHKNKHTINLEHGDLIIMKGQTQNYWDHTIEKSKIHDDKRVNLTFRKII